MKRINIGLIGEDIYDTQSIKKLLEKKYPSVRFKTLLKRYTGGQLDSSKYLKSLRTELSVTTVSSIVFIRDLDGHESETHKVRERKKWFQSLYRISGVGVLLLNISELEALVWADIHSFNTLFSTQKKFTGDPMKINNPKEELIRLTKKNTQSRRIFKVSDNPEIFSQLNFETVMSNCRYFKYFILDFEKETRLSRI